ncbi:muconolactone Delta-isomerase family protein [Actinacidiphila acidipaludis]|uniref:Muconolactone Delta-isomerase family protein n=1 Tax=Actinacidiphila acidipaludis TaxID=2873382 RepID=A0ABS7QL20_9ACTN|nr:muconolactone Delta-isomerase family protein [Streptomyces acidipaludis]MBY8883095.1 muconolactone Delta-isomerase family protein [Streptomyces acidipaludis]
MKEFLVEITTTIPDGTSQDEIDQRRAAERERAKELASTGHLARLWRPVGELRSIGVWLADDEDDLRQNVIGTLPLSVWMTFKVTPLQPHPNDPGPGGGGQG